MNNSNFFARVLCLLVIAAGILFYNSEKESREQQERLAEAEERLAVLEEQQAEILAAVEQAQKEKAQAGEAAEAVNSSNEDGESVDGVYEGEGQGYGGTVRVQVTLKNQEISDIQILNADGEDAAYLNQAVGILDTVIREQSTNVDVVSGATFTSTGILIAIEDALGKVASE